MTLRHYWIRTENQSAERRDGSTIWQNNSVPIAAHTPEYGGDTLMRLMLDVRFSFRYQYPSSGELTEDYYHGLFPIVAAGWTEPGDSPPLDIRHPQDERIFLTGALQCDQDYLIPVYGTGQPHHYVSYSNHYQLSSSRNVRSDAFPDIQAQAVLQVNSNFAGESSGFPYLWTCNVYFRSLWGSVHGAIGELP